MSVLQKFGRIEGKYALKLSRRRRLPNYGPQFSTRVDGSVMSSVSVQKQEEDKTFNINCWISTSHESLVETQQMNSRFCLPLVT